MQIKNNFTRSFTIFSVVLMAVSLAIYLWVPKIKISPNYPYIILFLYLFTLFIFSMLRKSLNDRMSKFVNVIMLINFGKLAFYSILVLVYAYLYREDAVSFILTFFAYYFLFTAFEVYSLLKHLKIGSPE